MRMLPPDVDHLAVHDNNGFWLANRGHVFSNTEHQHRSNHTQKFNSKTITEGR
jgi:hypothetical protein